VAKNKFIKSIGNLNYTLQNIGKEVPLAVAVAKYD
jgi:hypothetical protein